MLPTGVTVKELGVVSNPSQMTAEIGAIMAVAHFDGPPASPGPSEDVPDEVLDEVPDAVPEPDPVLDTMPVPVPIAVSEDALDEVANSVSVLDEIPDDVLEPAPEALGDDTPDDVLEAVPDPVPEDTWEDVLAPPSSPPALPLGEQAAIERIARAPATTGPRGESANFMSAQLLSGVAS